MKGNLIGVLASLLIHGSLLVLVTYGLATEKPIIQQREKAVPLRLAMFQEPTSISSAITSKTVPQAPPSIKSRTQPTSIVAVTTPQTIVKPKPLTKPKKKTQKLTLIPKKIIKKTPKKTSKKKTPKTKKITAKDPALDEMIRAYQTTQSNTPTKQSPPSKPKPAAIHTPKKQVKIAVVKPTNKQAEQHYKARLQQLISQQKTYPARAKRRHKEGTVIVSFTLYPNGSINQITIKQSSGSNSLDKAALQTIRRISGRLAFPPSIQRKQWQFTLPLVYHLR